MAHWWQPEMTFGYFWCGCDVWGVTQERTHPFLVALSSARRQKTCSKAACPVHSDGHQHLFWFPRFSEFSVKERIELLIANKLVSACFGKSKQWKSQGSTSPRGYKPGPCARGPCTRGGEKEGRGLARARGRLTAHTDCLNLCSNPAACSSKFHVSSEYRDPQIRADQVRSFCSSQITFAALASSVKMLKS